MALGTGFFRCSRVTSAQAMSAGDVFDFNFNISMMEVRDSNSDSRLVETTCVISVLKFMRSPIAESLFGD